jgi:hypothetical protein
MSSTVRTNEVFTSRRLDLELESHVWQRSQPWNRPLSLSRSFSLSEGFIVEFRTRIVSQTNSYVGNSHQPLTSYRQTIHRDERNYWLPNRSVLLHDNGFHLSTVLSKLQVPEQKHSQVFRKIEAVARSADRSGKPIVVDLTLKEVMQIEIRYDQSSTYEDEVLDTVILDSMEAHVAKPIPAIQALEKVGFQWLDSVCIMEEFEIGSEITRVCPLCRYPMPRVC